MIRKAERRKSKARIAIAGPSGSGKTYSSLAIAFGLIDKENPKIGVIDTENSSSELYAPEFEKYGGFYVIDLRPPYTVNQYIQAINEFINESFDVIIIDTLSPSWAGTGGLLDMHTKIVENGSNSYSAWREVTPTYNKLIETILTSPAHMIVNFRSKVEYVVDNSEGKTKIIKVGMSPIFRDGVEYEFTTFFEMSQDHSCRATKDRTGIFDQDTFIPSIETGKKILAYLSTGSSVFDDLKKNLKESKTIEKLKFIWEKEVQPKAHMLSQLEREELKAIKEQMKNKLMETKTPKKNTKNPDDTEDMPIHDIIDSFIN